MAKQSDSNGVEQGRPLDEKNGTLPEKEDGKNLIMDYSDPPNRDQWSSKVDFILSCVGFAVGLGNVWRFPYLCYKNGGGAFLIPYFISLICGGAPVFFLEIGLGQFMAQGGVKCWQICPIFQGIGIATTVIVFLLNIYYIIILAWDVAYCMHAFQWVLPWSHCHNSWNTERCSVSFDKERDLCANSTLAANLTAMTSQASGLSSSPNMTTNLTSCLNGTAAANFTPVDPVVEFWEHRVLQISGGIDEPNGIVWELAVALLFVWICVYFCVWKGIKWTGKVVYFTATFPYVVLTILLIRGVTLDGAAEGIIYYLRPDFSKLGEAQVWIDAGTQIFFSYAIALGAMTALGSYNKFNNNFFRDCKIIAIINSTTSLYAGFVIFSVLGFMAKEQGVSIEDVAESGPGLAFIAYPKAVTQMPLAPVWAVLFFFMIILIGLDSQFVGVEAFITVMTDQFPLLRRRWNREIFSAGYCIVSFLLGLTMVTRGGMYVFQLFDYYSASGMALLWVCFFECIAISWIYGVRRFYDNMEVMLGFRASRWMMVCWVALTPAMTVGIFIFMWVKFTPLTYNRIYEYPWWAQGLGMSMAFASMICIPGYCIYTLLATPGSLRQRWKRVTTPVLKPHQIPESWTEWERHQLLKSGKNLTMGPQNGVHLNGVVIMPDANVKLKDAGYN